MTLNSEGLLSCPFCLSELSVVRDYDGDPMYAHPDSENCVLSGSSWDKDTFDISAWNRRALPPVDGLEVVDLVEKMRRGTPEKQVGIGRHGDRIIDVDLAASDALLLKAADALQAMQARAEKAERERDEALEQRNLTLTEMAGQTSRAETAEARISSLEKENKRLREALTPSASTKAAYMGEFSIAIERHVNEDEEVDDEAEGAPDPYEHVTVPWTTIKEIMAAIRAYAQAEDHNG